MTDQEFYGMLRESGLELYGLGKDHFKFISVCTDFANMVARKKASKVASQIISAAIVAEREACAKICEDLELPFAADAIHARKNK